MNNMKIFEKYGVAKKDYGSAHDAKGDTYTCRDGSFVSTNLACDENPFKQELIKSKYILDFGCGVGRNLSWIMQNTSANYVGIDPNTYMTKYFWEVQKERDEYSDEWMSRTTVCNTFEEIPSNVKFDYVVSTFVLQHLGYRLTGDSIMNITDITQTIFKNLNDGAVWFAIEHDGEEPGWLDRWRSENNIEFDVYIRGYKGIPELTHRDNVHRDGHHLIIFKYNQN